MALLVDILARELKVWPGSYKFASQSSVDAEIYFDGGSDDDFYASERASDAWDEERNTYLDVTRAEWQAAVEVLNSDRIEGSPAKQVGRITRIQPEWNGEGLPPVGTVCELSSQGADWGVGTIQYTAENVIVWRWNNQQLGQACACYRHEVNIRPIRTPEQIRADESAIREREDAIEAMTAVSPLLDKGWSRKVCAALYDSGYRKQEPK